MLLSLALTNITGCSKSTKAGSDQNCILEQQKIRSYPSLVCESRSVRRRSAVFAKKNSSLTSGDNILKTNWFQNNWAHLLWKTQIHWTDWKFFSQNMFFYFCPAFNTTRKSDIILKTLNCSVNNHAFFTLLLFGTKHRRGGSRKTEWKRVRQQNNWKTGM